MFLCVFLRATTEKALALHLIGSEKENRPMRASRVQLRSKGALAI